jgi:hypothetical protein
MNSFKNNRKKSTLSFKVIAVCLLLSGSLVSPGFGAANCYVVVGTVLTDGEGCDDSQLTEGSLVIDNTVTSIGNSAFEFNTDLTSVTIPDSVLTIGYDAFRDNTSLTSVRFLGNAPAVGTNAFLGVVPDATAYVGYNATDFDVDDEGFWKGLIVDVGSSQYRESWQKVSGALTADDAKGKRYTFGDFFTFVDNYELFDVPVDADISIYIKGNPNNVGTGLCDPYLVIYDVTDTDLTSYLATVDDGGYGGSDGYNGKTCGQNYYDTFATFSTVGIDVSNYRIQVTTTEVMADGVDPILNEFNSGTYTLYVSVGSFTINNDSGSDSSPTTKTITPVVVKNADSITNIKNKTYLSKNSMKTKLRENNLFKYSASDSFKYQVFKSSKKSCGMRGNYVMRYDNSKTCDLYITRTNARGISNKYWVKINYVN